MHADPCSPAARSTGNANPAVIVSADLELEATATRNQRRSEPRDGDSRPMSDAVNRAPRAHT